MPENKYGFNIGDRIITTQNYDECPADEVGIVACLIDFKGGGQFEPAVVCRMESDGGSWHPILELYPEISDGGNADNENKTLSRKFIEQNGWSCAESQWYIFTPNAIKKYKGTYKRKVCACDVCGVTRPMSKMVRSKKGKYVCDKCLEKKSYSTKNDTVVGNKTNVGWTFGFEFECVPKSKEDEAVLVSKKWGFIPTSDSSLPCDGVELKSPTINGRSSLMRMFKDANNSVDFSDSRCGQHINIGNSTWLDYTTMSAIRSRSKEIFYPLEMEMSKHRSETERLCGRFFSGYCDMTRGGSLCHGRWLNLEHDNRMEFRISKFVTPEQYFNLCNMWVDIMDMIHRKYLKGGCTLNAAKDAAGAIVEIYRKYAGLK